MEGKCDMTLSNITCTATFHINVVKDSSQMPSLKSTHIGHIVVHLLHGPLARKIWVTTSLVNDFK